MLFYIANAPVIGAVPQGYSPQGAYAEKYALVISVENYNEFPRVDNAIADGLAVSRSLLKAGYTFVRLVADPPSVDSILAYLDEMLKLANSSTQPAVLTVFYAGHGFRTSYANYIVPASAHKDSLLDDSLPVSTVLRRISPTKFVLGILFLDACRTVMTLNDSNAYSPMTSNLPGAGFQEFQENGITVVAMAATAGRAAESVDVHHPQDSPYSWALSEFIPTPSVSLDAMFDTVRSSVIQDTDHRQEPVENKRAGTSHFYLNPREEEDAKQKYAWQQIIESGARGKCLEDYVNRYPAGKYVGDVQYLLGLNAANPDEPACILKEK